jgi:hypothetical protein
MEASDVCSKGSSAMDHAVKEMLPYEAPTLSVLGSVAELTQGCDKSLGSSDGFTFQGNAIVCKSS